MKKILLFLMVTLIGFAANAATVYFDNTGNWSDVYMYSWTDANNNGAWPGVKVTKTVMEGGHNYFMAETNYKMVIFSNGTGTQTKDCQVVDNMIYNANGATGNLIGGGTAVIEDTVYLAGNFNDYSSSDSNYKFTKAANGTYTLHLDSFAATSDFKVVYNGTWYGYTDSALAPGQTYTLGDTGMENSKLEGEASNVTFTYNTNANTLKVDYSLGGGVVTPPVDPTPGDYTGWYVNLGCDNWNTGNDDYWKGMAVSADGKVSWTGLEIGDAEFAIKLWNGTADSFYYAENIVVGTPTAMTYSATQMASSIAGAAAGDTFDVTYDCATNTITITKAGGETPGPVDPVDPVDPTPGDYTGWYVNLGCDNWNTGNDDYWKGVEVPADGLVSWTGLEIGDAEFAIKLWNGTADSFYYAENIPVGIETVMTSAAQQTASTIAGAAAGDKFDVVYNVAAHSIKVIKVGGTSGVELNTAEGEAEYFTLQGVKVENPAAGLYIKVVNGKATKVLVK